MGGIILEIYDPETSQQYALSGATPYDLVVLVSAINNSSLTFNGTTSTTFNAGNTANFNNTVLLNGTTNIAATADIGKTGVGYGVFAQLATLTSKFDTPVVTGFNYVVNAGTATTTFIDIVGRFPLAYFVETYGTNTKVTIRGPTQLRAGGVIIPNYRHSAVRCIPDIRHNCIVSGSDAE